MSTGGKIVLLGAAAIVAVLVLVYGGGPAPVKAADPTAEASRPVTATSIRAKLPPATKPASKNASGGAVASGTGTASRTASVSLPSRKAVAAASSHPTSTSPAAIEMGSPLRAASLSSTAAGAGRSVAGVASKARSKSFAKVVSPATKPAAKLPQKSASMKPRVVVVESGDTLSSIADRTLGDAQAWRRIAEANPSIDPDTLRIGQRLSIPTALPKPTPVAVGMSQQPSPRRTHRIADGETLSSIAELHYGSARHWNRLFEANRVVLKDNPDRLPLAVVLVIPE